MPSRSPSGSRMAMPSSDQIVWTSAPSRSPRRVSRASDHGAWTRAQTGSGGRSASRRARRGTARRPSAGRWAGHRRPLVRPRGRRGGSQPAHRVEIVPLASHSGPLSVRACHARGRPRSRATNAPDRAPQLDRPADRVAVPERQLAGLSWRRRHDDPVVIFVDPPGRGAERDDVADPGLVDHLLVELADAPTRGAQVADEEHAVQAAIRDRAAARGTATTRASRRPQPMPVAQYQVTQP